MNARKDSLNLWWLPAHVALGFLVAFSPFLAKVWGIVPLVVGAFYIIVSRNRNNEAALWASYYSGLDVLLRMSEGSVTWEFAKYAVILYLVLGFLVEKRNYSWSGWPALGIIVLMIPAAFNTVLWSVAFLDDISFNLSGLACLAISLGYFFKRPLSLMKLKKVISVFLLPVVSTCFFLFVKTPNFAEIEFTTSANFATSGGFGPNQVATVLGAGWLLLLVLYLYKLSFSGNRIVDIGLFALVLFRALFTFSRGGNFASVIALVGFLGIHLISRKSRLLSAQQIVAMAAILIVAFVSVTALDSMTEGVFSKRFTGKTIDGEQKEDMTTGRITLMEEELELFSDNPFGYGAGGSAEVRMQLYGDNKASHNEFSRLLSEHGVLGIAIIFILLGLPVLRFVRIRQIETRSFLVLFVFLSLATMMHSAMRVAVPGFFYGLAFIVLISRNDNSLYRQQTLRTR